MERAAHEHDAPDLGLDARLALERQRDIGERPDRHQRDRFGGGHQRIDNEIDGAAMRGGGDGVGFGEHLELRGVARAHGIEQRLGSARPERHIVAAIEAQLFPGQPRARLRIVDNRGDGAHVQLRRLQRQGQRQGIVDIVADIGIEDDGNALLPPARRAEQQNEGSQQFRHDAFYSAKTATIVLEANLGRCWARASNPLCGT